MSEQKQQPIISIDHVSMRFNLAKEKHESLKEYFVALLHGGVRFDEFFALSDVSFDIMPGDFYGLIGLNGSGKSTLLKVISGVYKPSAGKVTVNGTIAPLIVKTFYRESVVTQYTQSVQYFAQLGGMSATGSRHIIY